MERSKPADFAPPDRLSGDAAGAHGEVQRRRVHLGVCCMASKAASPPMQAILRRLESCGDFIITVFPEECILNEPIEAWPIVECLIAFFSSGFPLEKCGEYCNLRKPRCINNVEAQANFRSRTVVYRTLQEWCIPCPDHVIVDHLALQADPTLGEFVENENYVILNGKKISKPFVEKPEDGDRHDIWIYYPVSIGGGAKKLFRKVKDQSSEFDPSQNTIRRDGTYIYEPFLPTQGTDIKVYTVGAGYVHAEARKAPTVDGKVNRSKDGKEVRYPVVLTQGEKAIAAFIVKAFRQNICGFDILRTDGGSYVCDVNGWSFVKGNQKYYNDCSTLIRKHLLDECGMSGIVDTSMMMILAPADEVVNDTSVPSSPFDYSLRHTQVNKSAERLRAVIVVMRHGDRRPKEKMKFKTKVAEVLGYFDTAKEGVAEVKLKTLEEFENLKERMEVAAASLKESIAKLSDLSGEQEAERLAGMEEELTNMELLIPVLTMTERFAGLERKVQLKAVKWKQKEGEPRRPAQVQVVAKWGGELTVSGLERASDLGRRLRHDLYPNDPTGLLRLHSSFRHDFKIYSSQEGRCQITAAAFTKGFLDLEGDIIPILVSLVTRDDYSQGLLDEPIPKKRRDEVKQKIEELLMSYKELGAPDVMPTACPTDHPGLSEAARRIGSPLQLLHTIRYLALEYIESIAASKDSISEDMKRHSSKEDPLHAQFEHVEATDDAVPLGNQVPNGPGPIIPIDMKESLSRQWLHLRRKENRWRKLLAGFVRLKDEALGMQDDTNVTYDASKVPDVWDNLYYDMLTHRKYLGDDSCRIAEMMVGLVQPLNEWVCLSEYGISQEEKLSIGVDVTWRLLGKMLCDLEFMIEADVGSFDDAGQRLKSKEPAVESGDARQHGIPRQLSRICQEAPEVSATAAEQASVAGSAASASRPQSPKPPSTSGNDTGSPGSPGSRQNRLVLTGSRDLASSLLLQSPALALEEPARRPSLPNIVGPGDAGGPPDAPSLPAQEGYDWKPMARSDDDQGPSPSDYAAEEPKSSDGEKAEAKDAVPATLGTPPLETLGPPTPSGSVSGSGFVRGGISGGGDPAVRKSKLWKLAPDLRNALKSALRDSSDWHPRLNDQVAQLTDIKNTKIVRSRVYVTSASTMHSLFNLLRHGECAGDGQQPMIHSLGDIVDLSYLTHMVFRCYERDGPPLDQAERMREIEKCEDPALRHEKIKNLEKSRYRVEIAMSPGVQVFKDGQHHQWPLGGDLREDSVKVAPLKIIAESVDLVKLERFLTDTIKEYGAHQEGCTDDEVQSGAD